MAMRALGWIPQSYFKIFLIGAIAILAGFDALCASATGRIVAMVQMAVGSQTLSEFEFGAVESSGKAQKIAPGSVGSFSVRVNGTAGQAFSIHLPKEVVLHAARNAAATAKVSNFESVPPRDAVIAQDGSVLIHVGATRHPLPNNHFKGAYVGSFKLDVVY